VKPRSDSVFMKRAPKGAVTDFGHQPGVADLFVQLGEAPA
jgi:hypothetical protein